ncbi:MAG: HK97 gp10 family phage protein [Alphaproteobacteria bacterium]|nr:HK97 gp10 family phage protein [Alphaproteobacteria bacterium]
MMRSIPRAVKPKVRAAIDKGTAEITARMKYLAPEDDGDLKNSIRVEAGPQELSATVTAGGPTTTRPVRAGQSAEFDYALGQEFGTAETQAQPFFWPSVNSTNNRVRRRIDRAIGKAIKEEFSK